jgi:hypothetical protein
MSLGVFSGLSMAVASAATAAVYSPTVRRTLRQGAVYGMAGFLIARDVVSDWLAEPPAGPDPTEPTEPAYPPGPPGDAP